MFRVLLYRSVIVAFVALALVGCRSETSKKAESVQGAERVPVATGTPAASPSGEALFKQYCAVCHPDGGNVSDPARVLYGSVLKSNHITTPDDIVRIMRNPLSRMIRFDAKTLSDKDARAIAEYVLSAFK